MKHFDVDALKKLPHPVFCIHVEETSSTNENLKVLARRGSADYTLILADSQSAGKGRLGRSFYSEGGLYMSILLPYDDGTCFFLTHIAALAVARAIEETAGETARIKWVNDVYVKGRKVSGILAESIVSPRGRHIVLGIGVNLDTPEDAFPEEIRAIAGSIKADRSHLAVRILHHLFTLLDAGDLGAIRREYRERCFLVGKEVDVIKEKSCRKATVIGLTDNLALSVRYESGEREDVAFGEVSLRL